MCGSADQIASITLPDSTSYGTVALGRGMYDYGFFSFESKADFLRRSEEYWNPDKTRFWQDAGVDLVIDRREGYLLLGHGRAPAGRPAPQRRDVQPRPPQSGAHRRAGAGDAALRHRQPPLPGARPHRAGGGARGHLPAEPAPRGLRLGRRRGDGHRHQDRPAHPPEAQDRLDPQGLPRAHGPRGGHRRRALLGALPLRPAGGVRPGAVQRPRRDGGGARRRRRGRRGDRDDPGDVRLPAARSRATCRPSSGSASATARSTSRTRCRPG